MYHRLAICLTWDPGVWAHPVEMRHWKWDHSKVFCVIPGAHLPVSHVPSVGHLSHMGHWAVGPATRDETPHPRVFCVIPGAHIPVARVPLVGNRSYTGHWDVGPPVQDGTPGMGSFQGVPCHSRGQHPRVPCTMGRPLVSHGTLGCGPSHSRWTTLEWDHSKVFRVIPGAHIPVCHVLLAGHRSYTEPWDVGSQPQDGTPWYGIIPGCSMLFLEPAFRCPTYDRSAITQDTGTWAHSIETEHPQVIPFQSVLCSSGGPHCSVPCTHSWPLVSVLAVGAGYQ